MSAPRIAIAAALVLAVTDVAWSTASEFWVDHALFAGLVSGALLLLITVLVVDEVVEAREQRRSRDVAHELGGMLARQAQRVVSDARAELAAMRKERDEERRAARRPRRRPGRRRGAAGPSASGSRKRSPSGSGRAPWTRLPSEP